MTYLYEEFKASLGNPIHSFPPGLRQAYAETMRKFASDSKTANFSQIDKRDGFGDQTLLGVASRMHWWYPAHFFKFQESLLQSEQKSRKSNQPFLLDRPKAVFVDLGCGAGAASAAVLAILEQYQYFRRSKGLMTYPIEVHFIALDISPLEIDVYESFIGAYVRRIEPQKIYASVETIPGSFPEMTPEIIAKLSEKRGHVLIVGMSNLIHWIWKEYDEYLAEGRVDEIAGISTEEIDALRQMAEQADFDAFHVIGIAVQTGRYRHLPEKLKHLFVNLLSYLRLSDRPFGTRWGVRTAVLFENPQGSGWVKSRPQANSDFTIENLVDLNPKFANDKVLQKALSVENIERSWAKVRSHLQYDSLTDWVELKLFEDELESNILRLRDVALDRSPVDFNIQFFVPYEFPKGAQETRPKALARLEEQALGAAVCLAFASQLEGTHPEVSYSYRLASPKSEFLYEFWFQGYRNYLGGILARLSGSSVLVTDIASYYTNIRQQALLETLKGRLSASTRCYELIVPVVLRDCGLGHDTGFGLLQGHALSGLFGNVMMQPVDAKLVEARGLRGRYFRFTDDIAVTGLTASENPPEKVALEDALSARDSRIKLKKGKTHVLGEKDFRKRISGSAEFDRLSARFRALLLPLFLISAEYRRDFGTKDWSFVYQYQMLLQGLGFHFSPEWLHRKVDEYGRLLRQVRSLRRRWKLTWPSIVLTDRTSGRREWHEQFRRENTGWISERNAVRNALIQMFRGAAESLISVDLSEADYRHQRRAARFSLYRLNVFGAGDVTSPIVKLLLSQPWTIPASVACQALANADQEKALVEVIRESGSSHTRAVALRALGRIRTDQSVSILARALTERAPHIERLMASEGLLDANLWTNIDLDTIVGWVKAEMDDPYVLKNIIVMLGQAYPTEAPGFLREFDVMRLPPIARSALHYVSTKPVSENLLWKAEPKELRKYRASFYPTIEELLGEAESYQLVS